MTMTTEEGRPHQQDRGDGPANNRGGAEDDDNDNGNDGNDGDDDDDDCLAREDRINGGRGPRAPP